MPKAPAPNTDSSRYSRSIDPSGSALRYVVGSAIGQRRTSVQRTHGARIPSVGAGSTRGAHWTIFRCGMVDDYAGFRRTFVSQDPWWKPGNETRQEGRAAGRAVA